MIFTIQEDDMGLWRLLLNGRDIGLTFRSADGARKVTGAILDHAVLPNNWRVEYLDRNYQVKSPSEL